MGHKKKKHAKNYNKNSNKINITIHNDHKTRRRTNKPKSGISSQLGQPAQTSTALYNAKEDQSDLLNQASNYTNHVKKQYNALLENIAADEQVRQRPPLQIQQQPHQDNSLHSMMNRIMDAGGVNISVPNQNRQIHHTNSRVVEVNEPAPHRHVDNDLINVLHQRESIRASQQDNSQDNVLDLNVKAVKSRGRPTGSKNVKIKKVTVPSSMQTRSTTPLLNELAAATPVQEELNLGGNEPINNIDLNQKAVAVVKKKVGRPKKIKDNNV